VAISGIDANKYIEQIAELAGASRQVALFER
jgi:hypothetical protein